MTNNNEAKLMAKEICRFISERCDKKELSLLKDKPDKKGKGGINNRLQKLAEILVGKSNEELTKVTKLKKKKEQTPLEFQHAQFQQFLLLLNDFKLDNSLLDIIQEYQDTLQTLNQEYEPTAWLNDFSGKAKDISFATHVAKLTHSSSKSTCIYDKTISTNPHYLTTNSLKDLMIDTATANAASAPAGEILKLKVEEKSLLDFVKDNDQSPFNELTGNQEEIETWMDGFKQAYEKDKKNSHFLSKQVYFLVGDEKYHLLMPLVSSSMAHALFFKFKEFFDDEGELVIKQKKKNKYHKKIAVSYPKKASLKVPGKPQTASSLNGERGGRLTLLPTMPPQWSGKQQLPTNQRNFFNKSLGYKLREEINDLQRLLLVIKAKDIGMKKPVMHRAIVIAVNEIANVLFDEINKINLLSDTKGWSLNSDFPLHQQLLIEPGREDEVALKEKNKKQWQEKVAEEFSSWLNKQLHHKKLNLTTIQQRLWKDMFTEQLREFIAIQEAAS